MHAHSKASPTMSSRTAHRSRVYPRSAFNVPKAATADLGCADPGPIFQRMHARRVGSRLSLRSAGMTGVVGSAFALFAAVTAGAQDGVADFAAGKRGQS